MKTYLLRLRPLAAQTQGPLRDSLTNLAVAWTGDGIEAAFQQIVSGFDSDLRADIGKIIDWLQREVPDGSLLLVDLLFSRAQVPRALEAGERLIAGLLSAYRRRAGGRLPIKVAVLMQQLPMQADPLSELLKSVDFAGDLIAYAEDGKSLGDLLGVELDPLALEHIVPPTPDEALRSKTVRRRGVFRGRSQKGAYHAFEYSVLGDGWRDAERYLVEYLERNEIELLIYDDAAAEGWFARAVQGAGLATGVGVLAWPWPTTRAPGADAEIEGLATALERLRSKDTRVCYVVAGYQSGKTLQNVYRATNRGDLGTAHFLAVLCDDSITKAGDDTPGFVWRQFGKEQYRLDYILSVPIRALPPDDWRVRSAGLLREVEDGASESLWSPGKVALWSLLAECDVRVEEADLVPVRPGRRPVRYFPDLNSLSRWDAHWLAELVVRRVLQEIPVATRSALYFIIPNEKNGTDKISQALRTYCGVGVLRLGRQVIEGKIWADDDSLARLKRHASDTVVVFDESTVTYETLRKMTDLVRRVAQSEPDIQATILDLTPRELRSPGASYFTLISYTPSFFGDSDG